MQNFNSRFKFIIYCIGLGVALIVYAHANFSTVKQVDNLERKVEISATSADIVRLENKVDKILFYMIGDK